MQYIFYFLGIIFLLALGQGLFLQFAFFGAVPNLILLFVLALAVKQENLDFYFAAFVGGLFLDMLSGVPLGSFTLYFLIVGQVTHQLFSNIIFYEFNIRHLPLLVLVSVSLMPLWLWIYAKFLLALHVQVLTISLKALELQLLPSLLYNFLLMYPVYWFATKLFMWGQNLGRRRRSMS